MLTPSRLILYGAKSPSQSWRPRWHKGSLSNSKTTLMEAPLTRPCGFGLDGTEYEIDLRKTNASKFRRQIAPYIDHARKAGRGQRRRPARSRSGRERSGDIRAWAKDQGIPVSERGRIPASVAEQYQAATTGA